MGGWTFIYVIVVKEREGKKRLVYTKKSDEDDYNVTRKCVLKYVPAHERQFDLNLFDAHEKSEGMLNA